MIGRSIRYDKRPNRDIRKSILESGIPQYEIARRCGVNETTLSHWLRYELPEDDDRRQIIIEAIEKGN